jgi:hypothetical protein
MIDDRDEMDYWLEFVDAQEKRYPRRFRQWQLRELRSVLWDEPEMCR